MLFGQIFLSFGQQKVTLKTGSIAPTKVSNVHLFLAGDFNNWDPADPAWEMKKNGPGEYEFSKALPANVYNFKITRGSWETVECTADGKPIDNRVLNVTRDTIIVINVENWQDNFPAVEKQHTASAQVHIISEKFEMPQLGRQRRVWIYLPRDYNSTKSKYPVIYMHDGQNLFDAYTSAYGEWGIDEILDKMPSENQCIVVGVDHGGDYRITEYDPYGSKYGKGRGDDYVDFLVKTLKPYIDANYRSEPDAAHTTIAGSSMGGLISVYAALKYPEVFGNAGIFSPAFWIAPEIYNFAQQSKLPPQSRFYFVCGGAEGPGVVPDMQKMADIIQAKGIDKKNAPVTIIKGAAHNEKQWNGDFPDFYKWLIDGLKIAR